MKNNKIIMTVATIVLAVIAAVFSFGIVVSSRSADGSPYNELTEEAVAAATYKQGSTGSVVKTIQTKLKRWGYYSGAIDGIYGSKTKAAVRYFQQRNGLTVDGVAGPKTLAAMGISSGTTSGTSSSASSSSSGVNGYTSSDVELLARLIYGEARGESYTGQVAVGAVVLNRVKSASFPNTVSAVIYQPYAFTAVSDGQINLTPNSSCREAAKAAMNGWDPTYGAIYYYNPSTATSKWIFSRTTTVTIGNHVFAV
ncbi:MAG: spore cortex-lytic enzyme [Clostridia bacterium]|nr:spore cortex-lytic enzyme [Clostridia bacterium]